MPFTTSLSHVLKGIHFKSRKTMLLLLFIRGRSPFHPHFESYLLTPEMKERKKLGAN